MAAGARPDEASKWWGAQRLRYNTVVIATAAICGVMYIVLASGFPNVELTVFTLGFQFAAGVLYVVLANVAYSLGAVVECRMHPTDVRRFRSKLFLTGVVLTVAPFVAAPALFIYRRVAGV